MQQMVALKMIKLGIENEKIGNDEGLKTYSFVLINPSPDFVLQTGDIVYLIKPGNFIKQKDSTENFENETEINEVNESINQTSKTIRKQSNVTFI
jgi:hypothetical protein